MKLEAAKATVAELRREFDGAFALAPRSETARMENLLAVSVGGDGFALRVAQIAGLYSDKPVTPLPSPLPELQGLAGFRGRPAPVYDLAALLGYATTAASTTRWLVLARAAEPLALAFESFEAHFAVAADTSSGDIVRAPGTTLKVNAQLRPQVFDAVRFQNAMRPIIDLDTILESIRRRASAQAHQGSI